MPFDEMLSLWLLRSGRNADAFWEMSAREYEIWLEGQFGTQTPLSRKELNELMERFSD